MMKASDIMSLGAATIGRDGSAGQAIRIMCDHRISALPVVDEAGHLVGIVSEGDFFRAATDPAWLEETLRAPSAARSGALAARKVAAIMTSDPIAIEADTSLDEAIELMGKLEVRRLPVVANDKVTGVISRADVLHALIE